MDYRITFLFASRSRPAKFFAALENIKSMSVSDNYNVICAIDEDDLTMNNEGVLGRIKTYSNANVKLGLSQNKIHAINRTAEGLGEGEILIIMSDDIIWDVHGFDNIIREAFNQYSPNLDFAIHFPDDHGKSKTIIVSILGFNLFKQLGYLYHPDFDSVYADDFFTFQTKQMGKYAFVNKRLYTHAHPLWGLSEFDLLYKRNEASELYAKDKNTFIRLRQELINQ